MKRILLLGLWLAAAQGQGETRMEVIIDHPSSTRPVFGSVEFRVEVFSPRPVAEVELRVDGTTVARLEAPPWSAVVDVGQENRGHRFEATARDVDGRTVTATRETRPVHVDLQLDLALQQLYVTVTRDGRRVPGLLREDFRILDEGERQEIVTFEGGDVPLTAVLLVDTSLSMRGSRLAAVLEGAATFVREMRELDEAMGLLFSDQLVRATAFTGDPAALAAELEGVDARGGTAINDHLYLALKLLEARQGRRVVILLSDGVDVESVLRMEEVLWKAGRVQAMLYWIRPRAGNTTEVLSWSSAWRNGEQSRAEYEGLARAVAESGGRVHEIDSIEEAPAVFLQILAELREQYVIGYYPSEDRNDGSWHDVRVKVEGFGLSVRTRSGYLDH